MRFFGGFVFLFLHLVNGTSPPKGQGNLSPDLVGRVGEAKVSLDSKLIPAVVELVTKQAAVVVSRPPKELCAEEKRPELEALRKAALNLQSEFEALHGSISAGDADGPEAETLSSFQDVAHMLAQVMGAVADLPTSVLNACASKADMTDLVSGVPFLENIARSARDVTRYFLKERIAKMEELIKTPESVDRNLFLINAGGVRYILKPLLGLTDLFRAGGGEIASTAEEVSGIVQRLEAAAGEVMPLLIAPDSIDEKAVKSIVEEFATAMAELEVKLAAVEEFVEETKIETDEKKPGVLRDYEPRGSSEEAEFGDMPEAQEKTISRIGAADLEPKDEDDDEADVAMEGAAEGVAREEGTGSAPEQEEDALAPEPPVSLEEADEAESPKEDEALMELLEPDNAERQAAMKASKDLPPKWKFVGTVEEDVNERPDYERPDDAVDPLFTTSPPEYPTVAGRRPPLFGAKGSQHGIMGGGAVPSTKAVLGVHKPNTDLAVEYRGSDSAQRRNMEIERTAIVGQRRLLESDAPVKAPVSPEQEAFEEEKAQEEEEKKSISATPRFEPPIDLKEVKGEVDVVDASSAVRAGGASCAAAIAISVAMFFS